MNLKGLLKKIPSKARIIFVRKFHKSEISVGKFLANSANAHIDKNVYDRYMCLPMPECKIQAKYVWIDGTGEFLRSKTKTLDFVPNTYKECPKWWCDGSSCHLGKVEDSDIYLIPIAMYPDPFRRGNNKLILCETYSKDKMPTISNHRMECIEALNKICDQEALFGFAQEYYLLDADGKPFGWPKSGQPKDDGQSYCGVGASNVYAREINECIYRCGLYSGIDIYGTNAQVMPGQWEWQSGPSSGIKGADDLWMTRFIAMRVAEDFGVQISFKPKLAGHQNLPGSGLHLYISTRRMREEGGLKHIEEAIKKLANTHKAFLKICDPYGGKENEERLTGRHRTSMLNRFDSGVANRTSSVKITRVVAELKRGYFQDRRPGANADPYQLVNAIVRGCFI